MVFLCTNIYKKTSEKWNKLSSTRNMKTNEIITSDNISTSNKRGARILHNKHINVEIYQT